ncbi:DNA replication and repair protein RecF [Alteromonadaceae bacterium Bs31]|nr:DNA replication and repair protein RecF [Alteromonadaceae bacterium Bs31]
MPKLQQINITSFRNLRSVSLLPGGGINLIHGANGSGKTSLLEAISVLAHGRSFRTHKYRPLVNEGEREFTLFAVLEDEGSAVSHKLGVTRQLQGDVNIRLDGQSVKTSAELAHQLPLLTMNTNSFQLLEGSSKYRRQFFDWLVFHVKHDFKSVWKDYVRCVKHRNSLLRRGKISTGELQPWDREVARLGHALEDMRAEIFEAFHPFFQNIVSSFPFNKADESPVVLAYHSGWKDDVPFEKQLQEHLERDIKLGYTNIGSHRSDLKITRNKAPATEMLSRGQQKSVILSLFLAEAGLFQQMTNRKALFLLDDLPAELDSENMQIVGKAIKAMESQVFVTAIAKDAIIEPWDLKDEEQLQMFHVKHGEIQVSPLTTH